MRSTVRFLSRLKSRPKDFTWKELCSLLGYLGFIEIKTGKTSGSLRKFADSKKNLIILHQPHPGNVMKQYALKYVIDRLTELGYLQDE
ncbi:MAG: type II toxin-antitoxin system HicA family toxin [Chitinophagaceae bacterium]|nr:type II toxin-antitoxin system HicA family toxin [Chitinophagaceae bacterium]